MKSDLDLHILSKTYSNEEKLNELITSFEIKLLNANENNDTEGIWFYDKLLKQAKEKLNEYMSMYQGDSSQSNN